VQEGGSTTCAEPEAAGKRVRLGIVSRDYLAQVTDPPVTIRPVVGVLALDAAGRVLLVRRADDGSWCLPGGGVEVGETWAAAAVRECREESGWQVEVKGLFGAYSDPATQLFTYADGRRVQFVGLVLLATPVELVGQPDGEVSEVAFFSRDSLPAPLFGPDRPILHDWTSGRTLPVIG
jgi:8-oxo-dGTP diphosphatase